MAANKRLSQQLPSRYANEIDTLAKAEEANEKVTENSIATLALCVFFASSRVHWARLTNNDFTGASADAALR